MERLKKIGEIKKYASRDISHSKMGIGFEKLDRGVFDPEKAYDKVAATGVKWIRLQSGWQRTETAPGEYHFEWLDSIVDNLLVRGLKPWLCLCYGNKIYDPFAAKIFGAAGCPPRTPEAKAAWYRYAVETAKRYKGKIEWFEVWNEPDGIWSWKCGPSGKDYGEFAVLTAQAVKEGNPDAKVIFGSQALFGLEYLAGMLAAGVTDYCEAYTYHNYSPNEQALPGEVGALKALIRSFNPNIKIIQGETGTQSRSDGAGAFSGGAWTPLKQAKFMARHTIVDFINDVMFSSYFSSLDMAEALNGTVDNKASYKDFGYFGILAAEFDEDGRATGTYTPKQSYRTLQTLASVFKEDFEHVTLPIMISPKKSPRLLGAMEETSSSLTYCGFKKSNGSFAYAYWKPTNLLTETYEATISMHSALPGKPRLIDLLDGSVYDIPEDMIALSTPSKRWDDNGNIVTIPAEETFNPAINFKLFSHLPIKDYPLLLTFGDFADFE